MWVGGCFVFGIVGDADVDNGTDARVGGEVRFDFVFVVDAGILLVWGGSVSDVPFETPVEV